MDIKAYSLNDKSTRNLLIASNSLYAKLFEFFDSHSLEELAKMEGKVVIDSDKLFVNFMTKKLKNIQDARLEVHNKYIDLQLVLQGAERIGLLERNACKNVSEDRLAEKDTLLYSDKYTEFVELQQGSYVVLDTDCAHAPCVKIGDCDGEVIKCVAKIAK